MLGRIRLVIVGLGVLFAGAFAGWQYWKGEGTVHVVAPGDSELEVAIDGAAPQTLQPGEHFKTHLPQGEHQVALSVAGVEKKQKVRVTSGFTDLVVPAEGQCFVNLDVTKSHYESSSSAASPTVDRRFRETTPFDLPGSTYFTDAELPRSLKKRSRAHLMVQIPCEEIEKSDAEILAELF
jgi:hypothetical protein